MGKVSYSAVVLDDYSHDQLIQNINVPDNFQTYCHHMTICLGELPENMKSMIGKVVEIKCTKLGQIENQVIAVKVDNIKRLMGGTPHITVAVNTQDGFKPKDSNNITDWTTDVNFNLKGVITEVSF